MRPTINRSMEAIKMGPLLKIKGSLFCMIPVLALTSDEVILESIPPLLVKKKMITDKATPVKNITSIILTEKIEATRYVTSNSIIKAAVIISRNFFLKIAPPKRLLITKFTNYIWIKFRIFRKKWNDFIFRFSIKAPFIHIHWACCIL